MYTETSTSILCILFLKRIMDSTIIQRYFKNALMLHSSLPLRVNKGQHPEMECDSNVNRGASFTIN